MTAATDIPMSEQHDEDTGFGEPKPVNILLCDDLPEKILVYKAVLEDLGQNIVTAHSGEEALKQVLQKDFAVILLDVNMPGMDGFETASLIRQRKKSSRTPIIFLTAFVDDVHAAQGYASGAVDYLLTPVMPEILKAKVKVFIELYQMRQQAAMQAEEHARRKIAEEADRRKDAFLGMLAHELRNPLGPIRNAIQLLQQHDSSEDPQVKQLRSIIDRQVTHMARLVDDLLDSTRLASGKILLRKEKCDLAQITRLTVEDYLRIFESSQLKLEVRLPKQPVLIDGDPTRLRQMIGNLLHNAHKFTNPGGEVTVTLTVEGGVATVGVRDTGIGIEAKMLPHVFEVFQQAEQGLDRTRGGLGLGLALVKGLASLHNGTISATSDGLGAGSVFTLRIPVDETASKAAATNGAWKSAEANAKRRILIIEDSIDAAETTRMILVKEGHEVHVASTGLQGIAAAHDFNPDVVLCDIGLPGIDGYQVVKRLRQDPTLSGMYVIALTGYGREKDRLLAREAGFDEHMTKPIDFPVLRRALTQLPTRTAQ